MCADAWQPFGFRERRFRDLDLVQPCTQVQQKLRVEAGADFSGKDEIISIEVPYEKRSEADAAALRIRESANDELLRRLALHLQPVRRAAAPARCHSQLPEHSFPPFAARALPRLFFRGFPNLRQRSTH